jgi:LysR family transcriptional regulator, hca operon transcriptional activator
MLIDDIEKLICRTPGLTAAALAHALFGEDGYNQRVNTECRTLVYSRRVERRGHGGPGDPFKYYPRLETSPVSKRGTGKEATRRTARPAKPAFAIGCLTGQEANCLPQATSLLRDELAHNGVRLLSDHSTTLAEDLRHGNLDVAFLRPEQDPDLAYKLLVTEPLVVLLPSDHRLAARKAIGPGDLSGETFIGISEIPRVLRGVISDYLKRYGIKITPHLEIDNFAMGASVVASTRGVALSPASAKNFLPRSFVSRPLEGVPPTIDLVIGYHKANTSPFLKMFLSRMDDLTTRYPANLVG